MKLTAAALAALSLLGRSEFAVASSSSSSDAADASDPAISIPDLPPQYDPDVTLEDLVSIASSRDNATLSDPHSDGGRVVTVSELRELQEAAEGGGGAATSRHRRLGAFDKFKPLDCNALVESASCDPFSSVVGGEIPCGACVAVTAADLDADGSLNVPGGLDVVGKLKFEHNLKANVITPHVFVQGVLAYSNDLPIAPENEGVKFTLTGTADAVFVPHTENLESSGCDSAGCSWGPKSFVVAGGRLNIKGMPDGCDTWTKIKDTTHEGPVATDWPRPATPPVDCPYAFVNDDFTASTSETTAWTGRIGALFEIESEVLDGGIENQFLRVTNRTTTGQGPSWEMEDLKDCLITGEVYSFAARVRIWKDDGTPTQCSTDGTGCPRLEFLRKLLPSGHIGSWRPAPYKESVGKGTPDGEWYAYTANFKLADYMTGTNVGDVLQFVRFSLNHFEVGVNIDMDDVYIGLPHNENYVQGEGSEVCKEIFPLDSGADSYLDPPRDLYPVVSSRNYNSPFVVRTETDPSTGLANSYYSLIDRHEAWESMTFEFPVDCLKATSLYELKMKVRITPRDLVDASYKRLRMELEFWTPDDVYRIWQSPDLGTAGTGHGWVPLMARMTVTDEIASATRARVRLYTEFPRDENDNVQAWGHFATVDYDDVSLSLVRGPTTGLVVEGGAATQCWGPGSELAIATHTDHWTGHRTATIESYAANPDGTAVLNLVEPIVRPSTEAEDPRTATEVALLSRNLKIEGDRSEVDKGGHLTVMSTEGVAQVLDGVEFNDMGRMGEERYPISMRSSGSVPDTDLSRNSIRSSHRRCIVVQSTRDVTLSKNVGFDTKGHCYAVAVDGGEEGNSVLSNLALHVGPDGGYGGEGWPGAAGFYFRNANQIVQGNVATGARYIGFDYHMSWKLAGDGQAMVDAGLDPPHPGGHFSPYKRPLGVFKDNVAHGNNDHGLFLYTHAPEVQAVYENFISYRNIYHGVWARYRYITFKGGYFADNRYRQISFIRCDSCSVVDAEVTGVSPEYWDVVWDQKVWHSCLWDRTRKLQYAGVEMYPYTDVRVFWDQTQRINNVTFSGFENTGCLDPRHVVYVKERRVPHYDLPTQASAITNADEGPMKIDLCETDEIGVDDVLIVDNDSSMHPDGPEAGSAVGGASVIVSNNDFMKVHAGAECIANEQYCYAYCPNTCLRFVTYEVDAYETEEIKLVVTDNNDSSKVVTVSGNWWCVKNNDGTPNVKENTLYNDFRYFSAALPAGEYTAEFMNDSGERVWPTFVREAIYEPAPDCGGVQEGSVTLLEPEVTMEDCMELVKNGDAEYQNGNYTHWYHRDGGVAVYPGDGVGGTNAIVSDQRTSEYHGPSFFVDTRCMSLLEGKELEFTAQVKVMNDDGTAFDCDPDITNYSNGCPRMIAIVTSWDGTSHVEYHWGDLAKVVRPVAEPGQYNLLHGTFVVSPLMANAKSVEFLINRTKGYAKIFLDDASLKPLALIPGASVGRDADGCSNGYVINGDFEDISTTTQYWDIRRDMKGVLSLRSGGADGSTTALLVSERDSVYQGPMQWLNPGCFQEGLEYKVTVCFRIYNSDGSVLVCDPAKYPGSNPDGCPEARIYAITQDVLPGQTRHDTWQWLAEVTDVGNDSDRWGTISGIFTPEPILVNAFKAYLYIEKAPEFTDLAIDDVSIVPHVKDCSNLVTNGDLELGTVEGWQNSDPSAEVLSGGGYGDSDYAMIQKNRPYSSYGISQELDTDCVEAGQLYDVRAKVKLLSSGGSTLSCDPNVVWGENGCPFASIVTYTPEGGNTRDVGAVVGASDAEGWYDLVGVFEVFLSDKESTKLEILIGRGAAVTKDLVLDKVEVVLHDAPEAA